MATTNVRVPGGGNTYIVAGLNSGVKLDFLASFNDQPGPSVGRPTQIHPIGSAYPVEIATPYAQEAGTITLRVWNTWGKDGWVSAFLHRTGDGNLTDQQESASPWESYVSRNNTDKAHEPVDLREVFEAQRKLDSKLTVQKWELGGDGNPIRVKDYQNCVITNIDATDDVNIQKMEQQVTITIMYTHVLVTSPPTTA